MWKGCIELIQKTLLEKDLEKLSSSFISHAIQSLAYLIKVHSGDVLHIPTSQEPANRVGNLMQEELRSTIFNLLCAENSVQSFYKLTNDNPEVRFHFGNILLYAAREKQWASCLRHFVTVRNLEYSRYPIICQTEHILSFPSIFFQALARIVEGNPCTHRILQLNLVRYLTHLNLEFGRASIMDRILLLLNTYPICKRYRVGMQITGNQLPFLEHVPRSARWIQAIEWFKQLSGPVSKRYFKTVCENGGCWDLNGFNDIGPTLISKVQDMTGDSRVKVLLNMGMIYEAGAETQVIPLTVTLSELSMLLGRILTPGHGAKAPCGQFNIQFRLRGVHGANVLLQHLDLRGTIIQDIHVNNIPASRKTPIKNGDIISFCFAYPQNSSSSISSKDCTISEQEPLIIYEDSAVVCYYKPSNYTVVEYQSNSRTLLTHFFTHLQRDVNSLPPRAGIVHRLDLGVSGLCIFAKTTPSYFSLTSQLRARRLVRKYIAVVLQVNRTLTLTAGNRGTIRTSHAPSGATGRKVAVELQYTGIAITHYFVREVFPKYSLALLECSLESGKRHQIRAHLSSQGAPILGDFVYGGTIASYVQQDANFRIFLHAFAIEFTNTLEEHRVQIQTSLPDHFDRLLENLRK